MSLLLSAVALTPSLDLCAANNVCNQQSCWCVRALCLHAPVSLPTPTRTRFTLSIAHPLFLLRCAVQTFWHSSAHVLGQALELEYGADLTIGPALEEGFYYDCFLGNRTLNDAEKAVITKRMQQV